MFIGAGQVLRHGEDGHALADGGGEHFGEGVGGVGAELAAVAVVGEGHGGGGGGGVCLEGVDGGS